MESTTTLTLTEDLVHQQHHLKEALSLALQQDTDMFIVSKDQKLIPCHSSLLSLFSPVLARLLPGVPCCSPPTIFLPDFPALPIKKLLHLLRSGQAVPGENVNVDIEMISRVAQVLEINGIDLNLGPYVENPLEVSFEIKKEINNFIVKEEMYSFEEEMKDKVLHVKQESDSYNGELKSMPIKREDEYIEQEETKSIPKPEYMGSTDFLNNMNNFQDDTRTREKTDLGAKDDNGVRIGTLNEWGKENLKQKIKIKRSMSFQYSYKEGKEYTEDNCMKPNEEQDRTLDDGVFSVKRKVCSVCGKSFGQFGHLKEHMRIHRGEKPYSCEHCTKKFNKKSHLVDHTRIHTGEKPFSCSICPQKFTRKSHLEDHRRIHTGEKPFSCSICPQKFARKSNLVQHTRIHTGEKLFSCLNCPKKFAQKSDFNRHTRIHTGEKPFSCSICPKKFAQKSSLVQHTRMHTGEKPFRV